MKIKNDERKILFFHIERVEKNTGLKKSTAQEEKKKRRKKKLIRVIYIVVHILSIQL